MGGLELGTFLSSKHNGMLCHFCIFIFACGCACDIFILHTCTHGSMEGRRDRRQGGRAGGMGDSEMAFAEHLPVLVEGGRLVAGRLPPSISSGSLSLIINSLRTTTT